MRFLSISEAADALNVSPRQIRHLGLGSTRTAEGNARIFDAADLTVLRVYVELAKRFSRWDLAQWKARAAALYLEPYIRAAMRGGSRAMAIVVDDVRGVCEVRPASAVGPRDVVLKVSALHAESVRAVEEQREQQPAVWAGHWYTRRPALASA
jgi:hypothetical protein